jgi:hypothetical protein
MRAIGRVRALGFNPLNESPKLFGNTIRDDPAKYGKLIKAM